MYDRSDLIEHLLEDLLLYILTEKENRIRGMRRMKKDHHHPYYFTLKSY